jgi:hypothetical protein
MGQIHCKKGNQYRTRDWVPHAFKSAYLESRDLNSCNLQSNAFSPNVHIRKEPLVVVCWVSHFILVRGIQYIHKRCAIG